MKEGTEQWSYLVLPLKDTKPNTWGNILTTIKSSVN